MSFDSLAGMVFALVMTVVMLGMIGGIILLGPLARRAGELLELSIQERRLRGSTVGDDVARLQAVVEQLEAQVSVLQEHQEFTQRLLEERAGGEVPSPE